MSAKMILSIFTSFIFNAVLCLFLSSFALVIFIDFTNADISDSTRGALIGGLTLIGATLAARGARVRVSSQEDSAKGRTTRHDSRRTASDRPSSAAPGRGAQQTYRADPAPVDRLYEAFDAFTDLMEAAPLAPDEIRDTKALPTPKEDIKAALIVLYRAECQKSVPNQDWLAGLRYAAGQLAQYQDDVGDTPLHRIGLDLTDLDPRLENYDAKEFAKRIVGAQNKRDERAEVWPEVEKERKEIRAAFRRVQ